MTTPTATATGLLALLATPQPPPFAVLHRPEVTGPDTVEVLVGDVFHPSRLADVPLPDENDPDAGVLVVLPYRQLTERGLKCVDDGASPIAMRVTERARTSVPELLAAIAEQPTELTDEHFDIDDDEYADLVRSLIDEEIGQGQGANFVVMRSLVASVPDFTPSWALTVFGRLLRRESGAYWTFLVHTGERTFVGASPERHVTVEGGTAVMNPISGTYRYPDGGPRLPDVLEFLSDGKETDELYMVVDEELKMMSRICDTGVRVRGPYLKEMARLAHTEYFIEGHTDRDVRDVLRETMFAPTVTGSPLESACRVIRRYEPAGRGYYGGGLALLGRDEQGRTSLDSAILIRTAEIDRDGRMRIGVGATVVRHSDPASEAAETRAKAAALRDAMRTPVEHRLGRHPRVRAALERRNGPLAEFWLDDASSAPVAAPVGHGRVLIVDAEDTFTAMMDHQLRAMGMHVTIRRFDAPLDFDDHDVVLLGPGPGDPADPDCPKAARLRETVWTLLADRRPFLAVCLSHQVLSRELGFPLVRRQVPNQGVQRTIDLFGVSERVGFYNTFTAVGTADKADIDGVGLVEISRDPVTGEIDALRGPHFCSMQFHPESVLTKNGPQILGRAIREVWRP
jgi:phenazine biosynthesis protein phzE